MTRSIQDVARLSGVTSRTLRHYDAIGLLRPSGTGSGRSRRYDDSALARLQRILLLRGMGLSLAAIGEVLDGTTDHVTALADHLVELRAEQGLLERRISSVEATVHQLRKGSPIMAEKMFDGFDHTRHRAEVEERWGADAYRSSDSWWRAKSPTERADWKRAQVALAADWAEAAQRGLDPAADEAQALARRQYEWLAGIPGTPQTAEGSPTREYFLGLGEMYVADERFGANYGGVSGATFVRDSMVAFADRWL